MKTSLKPIAILLAAAVSVTLFSSCVTTSKEKEHTYIYDDPKEGVTTQPWVRPESYEGNPFGSSVPQSR